MAARLWRLVDDVSVVVVEVAKALATALGALGRIVIEGGGEVKEAGGWGG